MLVLRILLILSFRSAALAVTLSKSDEAARDAAVQWLQLVDASQFEEAASQASQEVRAFEQWQNSFKGHRALFGRVHNRQLVEIKHTAIVAGVPDVRRYYVVRFNTSFEHKPAAVEEIVLTKIGCCWEIFEYKISDK